MKTILGLVCFTETDFKCFGGFSHGQRLQLGREFKVDGNPVKGNVDKVIWNDYSKENIETINRTSEVAGGFAGELRI